MKVSILLFALIISTSYFGISQNLLTSVAERIDTIVVYDTETKIEEIKILHITFAQLDADFCDSFHQNFKATSSYLSVTQARNLSTIDLNCNGLLQKQWDGDWEIKSFELILKKPNQVQRKITNKGWNFNEETKMLLTEVNQGDILAFEQIQLAHPKKGHASLRFMMEVK
ncbi:MAG: hypothetical protein IPM92_04165 [Saprospiraceae bacterium]|nr:hypothetical protein [Saprospiraceae bacterium]